jgi:hypothetical protein
MLGNLHVRFGVGAGGKSPRPTPHGINGAKICEFDAADFDAPRYDREKVAQLLGREGMIGLEVHSGGQDRRATGAVLRWRNIYVREL